MDDDIQLPPLPPFVIAPIADEQTIRDYARTAVLADRERRAEQVQPAGPKVHSARVVMTSSGYVWMECGGKPLRPAHTVTLCWTDDGRVWIDSKLNRELAESLRGLEFHLSANALDGGVR